MAKHSFINLLLQFAFLGIVTTGYSQSLLTASLNTPGESGILSENCGGPYELVLRRGVDNDTTTSIFLSATGTATIGTDYSFPPGSIPAEMAIGDSVIIIPILVNNDGLIEGLETVLLEIAFLAGIESDFITLETSIADAYEVEINSPTDTIVWCRNVPYVLLASSNADEIFWSPSNVFDDSLGTAATVRPFESGWYYASVGTDTCGDVDSVYFDLAIVEIDNPDTVYLCNDENGVQLQGQLLGLATEFLWIPSDTTLSNPDILTPIANPSMTTTYILQSDIGVCTASDKVVVRIDSLPQDLHIDIAPLKAYYCAGEIVALFSPTFDSLSYPDITFNWTPDDGTFQSDLTLLNAALELQDTTLYIRENLNNACRSTDSILINVVPSAVPLSVNDTILCPGEMFNVLVLSDQVTDPEWTPKEGLSCTKCLNPKVTVTGTPGSSLLYQFSGKINECPVGASLSIQIPPVQIINISGDHLVCSGDVIQLTITNPEGLSDFDWDVTGDASLSCDDCPNPIVTIDFISGPISLTVSANSTNGAFCGAIGGFIFTKGETETINITGDTTVCEGEMVNLTISNPAGLSDFNWSVVSGNVSFSCDDCPNPVVTINSISDDITLLVTAISSNGDFCEARGTFVFKEGETNQFTGPTFLACLGETVTVSTGDPTVFDVVWSVFQGNLALSCTDCETPVVTVNGPVNQLRFTGETTNPNFCNVSGTLSVNAFAEDISNLILEPDPQATTINQGSPVLVSLAAAPDPISVMWTINGVLLSTTTSSVQFNADAELNTIVASFINSHGCEQIDTISFTTVPPTYQIPNAFTPNGDEINNTFRIIINGEIFIDEFLIFNRWGQLVYEAPQDDLAGWDGMFKGEPAASDTYVFSAKLRFPDGHIEMAKGDVILLR